MRLLSVILVSLLALIQYPLWLGKGSWLRVWELDRQLSIQRAANHRHELRNAALENDVRDLKQGLVAVEEIARYELGMVRSDEVFVQFNASGKDASPAAPARDGIGLIAPESPLIAGAASAQHR